MVNEDKYCCRVINPNRKHECGSLNISVNGHNIAQVKTMTYLGLEIDEHLSWNDHVNKVCKTLCFKITKLARLCKTLPKEILVKIYNSTIQTSIDYVISVWGCTSQTNINKIQRLQNYCARLIENDFDYVNSRGLNLVKRLGWMTVKERFSYFQTLLMFKCIHDLAPLYLTNNIVMEIEIKDIRTRRHDMDLYLPVPESEFYKNVFFLQGSQIME